MTPKPTPLPRHTRPLPLFSAALRTILSTLILAFPAIGIRADAPVGSVVNGNATFNYDGSTTTITASDRTIIEYNRFNIAQNETVNFVQPTSTSRLLNRVTGADPTSILGSLNANGIVYFVNPNGIYFGQHATVNVGQLYAAAGSLSNADFLARNDNFTRLSGQVENAGAVNASAIHLLGRNVRNTGALDSPAGLVMLAAGDDILIARRGEHLYVNATATTENREPGAANREHSLTPGVENTGQINAAGGRALLAAGDLYALAIQNTGIITARDIALEGQGSGEVWNRGTLDATSASNTPGSAEFPLGDGVAAASSDPNLISHLNLNLDGAAVGGSVVITGQHIGLSETSLIDASGATGGGQILIGGDYQGSNPDIRNATATYVAEGATLRADATDTGVGGRIIVWADATTRFHGAISARGITAGGFAEVSGAQNLLFTGHADLRSVNGKTGTLLLDPDNITISTAANNPIFATGSLFGPPGTNGDWNLNVDILTNQLNFSSVTVRTTDGDITVADAFSWTAATTLTLNSGNDIFVNAAIDGSNDGALVLTAVRNIDINANANITAGEITFTGNGVVNLDGAIQADSGIGARSGNISITSGTTILGSNGFIGASNNIALTGGLDMNADSSLYASGAVNINGLNRDITLAYIDANTITVSDASNITISNRIKTAYDQTYSAANDITLFGVDGALLNTYSAGLGGSITLTAQSGTVSLLAGAGGGAYIGADGDILITGGLYGAAGSTLESLNGDIAINATNRNITALGNIQTSSGDITLAAGHDITLGGDVRSFDGDITLTATNASTITINGDISTTFGAQTYAATGDITIAASGALGANTLSFTSGTGDIRVATGANITVSNSTTINGGFDIASSAYFQPGQLTIDARTRDVTIASNSNPRDISITNARDITIDATLSDYGWPAASTFVGSGVFTLNGSIGAGSGWGHTSITSGTININTGASLSASSIALNGAVKIASGATISIQTSFTSTGGIAINGQGRDISIASDISVPSVSITNFRDLTLAGLSTSQMGTEGDITFTGNGVVTLGGAIVAGSAGYAAVNITSGTTILGAAASIKATDVTLSGGLDMDANAILDASGAITINGLNRDITLAGNIATATTLTATNASAITITTAIFTDSAQTYAATGNITLSGTAALETLNTDQDVTLASASGTISLLGNSAINAAGNLTFNGSLHVGSDASAGAADAITINGLNRDISLAGNISASAVTATNAASITLDGAIMASTAVLLAANGNITTNGNFNAIANDVTITSGSNITINFVPIGIEGINLAIQSGDITLTATGNITINSALKAVDTLSITSLTGTTSIAPTGGYFDRLYATDITITGGLLMAPGSTLFADGGAITIDALNRAVTLANISDYSYATATVTATNASTITFSGIIDTSGAQTYSATGAITLNDARLATGDPDTGITLTSQSGTISLLGDSYINPYGNLTLTGGLYVGEDSGVAVAGALTIDALNRDITLDGYLSSYARFTATNAAAITIAGEVQSYTDVLLATAGDVSLSGYIGSPGAISITSGGTISIATDAGIGGIFDVPGLPNITLSGGVQMAADSFLYASGAININALNRDITLAGTIAAATITATNAATITVTTAIVTPNAQTYAATGNIALTGTARLATNNTGANISLTSATGTVSLASTAAIYSAGAIAITGALTTAAGSLIDTRDTINVNASGRAIAISGTITSFTGGTYANASDIAIGGLVRNAGTGDLTFVGNAAFTVSGGISASSGGAVSLASQTGTIFIASTASIDGRPIALAGGVDIATGATLDNVYGTGDITIDALNRDVSIRTDLALSAGTLAITNARDITLAGVATNNAQSYTAARNLTLTGALATMTTDAGVTLAATTGTVSLAATGAIDARGAIAITGALAAAAGSSMSAYGDININALARDVSIAGDISASAITATNASTITISGSLFGGDILLDTTGDTTITGDISVTNTASITSGGTTTLSSAAGLYGSTLNLAGGLHIANGASLRSEIAVTIDALYNDIAIAAALTLPNLAIINARHIAIDAVTTTGDQTYRLAAPAGLADGAMQINGPLVSHYGDISISSNSDFPAPHATIFTTSPAGLLISATAGSITIGRNDTLLAYDNGTTDPAAGSITLIAGHDISTGAISAARSITLSAGNTITLEGATYQAPAITLAAASPLAISNTATIIATASGGLTLPASTPTASYIRKLISDASMTGGLMRPDYFPTTPAATGAPISNLYLNTEFWTEVSPAPPAGEYVQNTIAKQTNPDNLTIPETRQAAEFRRAATDTAFGSILLDNTIDEATASQLRQLGIFSRVLTPGEREALYAWLAQLNQEIPTEIRLPEMYLVASGRLSNDAAQAAIRAYRDTFLEDGQSRIPALQDAIRKAYAGFRAANPGAPASTFVRYIDTQVPGTDDTRLLHDFFENVRALFLLIENLGLTNNEVLVSKNVILRPLRISGLPSNLLAPLQHVSPSTNPLHLAANTNP